MQKTFRLAALIAAIIVPLSAGAQALSEKQITKDAKKQAKVLKKEGWKVAPGHPSIEVQQLRASKLNNVFDEEFNQKYVFGSAQAVGPTYDAAKFQATELAKIDIAGKITSDIAGLVKTNIGNSQVEPGQAAAIVKSVGNYKSFVAAKLINIISVVDMYKPSKKSTTVSIGIFYNREEAVKAGLAAVREELNKESEELGEVLDNLLNLK